VPTISTFSAWAAGEEAFTSRSLAKPEQRNKISKDPMETARDILIVPPLS
jgi:hypothetical protein